MTWKWVFISGSLIVMEVLAEIRKHINVNTIWCFMKDYFKECLLPLLRRPWNMLAKQSPTQLPETYWQNKVQPNQPCKLTLPGDHAVSSHVIDIFPHSFTLSFLYDSILQSCFYFLVYNFLWPSLNFSLNSQKR